MKKILVFVISLFILLYLIKTYDIYYPIQIVNTTKSTELSVVGEGKVDVVPDTAYVELGITVNNASTVEKAQQTITDSNNKLIDALKGLGVAKEDITTSNFSTSPNYSYEGNQNRITGYNGNVTVSIKVKNKDLISQVIAKATSVGVNEIHGTRFTVEDPGKYREEARTKAINNAKEQAQKIAKELGINLGKVTNIVESSASNPVPMYYDRAMTVGKGEAGTAPQLEEGTQTISSVVTLYFEKR